MHPNKEAQQENNVLGNNSGHHNQAPHKDQRRNASE